METLLPNHFLSGKPFIEHHQYYYRDFIITIEDYAVIPEAIQFKNKKENDFCCFKIEENRQPYTSYFIGADWLSEECLKAVYIQPKVNKKSDEQVDYVSMLFSLLKHPETFQYVNEIYEIKWDSKPIEIPQVNDHLTPLLIVQFLQVLKQIVRKGLKKSYYKVEQNLYAKVKGKVMVAQSIKHNLLKNKSLNTYCSFDEFGFNGLENRLLKRALVFVKRYLGSQPGLNANTTGLDSLFNFISPAFENICEEVNLNEVKHSKTNAFYKEYEEGLKLAKFILKKFGYNITNTSNKQTIKTPPFWIDMSKLFELYILGILKDVYGDKIKYGKEAKGFYGLPDYLYSNGENSFIIDAKYREIYQSRKYYIENIRQISAYARDKKILKKLNLSDDFVVPCLIIYPTKPNRRNLIKDRINIFGKLKELTYFSKFYKLGIPLPIIKN